MGNKTTLVQGKFLESAAKVDIDEEGKFKYVLIIATQDSEKVYFVAGYRSCEYHANVFEEFITRLSQKQVIKDVVDEDHGIYEATLAENNKKVRFTCPGGGRIEHSKGAQKLFIYGYSQGFGQADHQISLQVAQDHFKDYPKENFTWSNSGY